MTPLAQLVSALLESADPLADLHPDAFQALGDLLAPLELLYTPRDLLTATAVLEAVAPMLLPPVGRPV